MLIAPHIHGSMVDVVAPTVLGGLFAGLLAILLPARTTFGISDTSVFSKLGKYTYGLYLYHTIVINALLQVFRRAGLSMERACLWCALYCVGLGHFYCCKHVFVSVCRKTIPSSKKIRMSASSHTNRTGGRLLPDPNTSASATYSRKKQISNEFIAK